VTIKQSRKTARDFVEKHVAALSADVLIWRKSASLPSESPLSAAIAWRDDLLAKLPSAATTLGSYRSKPQKNKRSYNRVGISRYIGVDRRKLGAPGYLRFAVNWVDGTGQSKVTSFQVGKVGAFSWEDELHAACTAEAFRTQWEFSRATGHAFDPANYEGWRHKQCYPFNPVVSDQGEHK